MQQRERAERRDPLFGGEQAQSEVVSPNRQAAVSGRFEGLLPRCGLLFLSAVDLANGERDSCVPNPHDMPSDLLVCFGVGVGHDREPGPDVPHDRSGLPEHRGSIGDGAVDVQHRARGELDAAERAAQLWPALSDVVARRQSAHVRDDRFADRCGGRS